MFAQAGLLQHEKDHTLLTNAGRNPAIQAGYVNPTISQGSTILAENLCVWEAAQRNGNPYG